MWDSYDIVKKIYVHPIYLDENTPRTQGVCVLKITWIDERLSRKRRKLVVALA